MAFHKPRDPYTKAGVWSAYSAAIGAKRLADLLGLSLSSIYNATDPDHPYSPADDLDLYETLDRLCVEGGHAAPFARYYAAKVGAPAMSAERHMEAALIDLGACAGETFAAHSAASAPESEAGTAYSEAEYARIMSKVAEVEGATARIREAAKQRRADPLRRAS